MSLDNIIKVEVQDTEDVLMRDSPLSPCASDCPDTPVSSSTNTAKRCSPSKRSSSAISVVEESPSESFDDQDDKLRKISTDPAWIEERRHYQKIVSTFRLYSWYTNKKLSHSVNYLNSLSKSHQELLEGYRKHLNNISSCIKENQNLFLLMILEESRLFENQEEVYPSKTMKRSPPEPSTFDFEKVQAVLKQLVRDWSSDGCRERELCYKPIVDEVEKIFGVTKKGTGLSHKKILVPGAGLGRLAHDLVRKGYIVEGNEFSLFMLFASNFLLNKCSTKESYKCYPWIHQTTNVLNREDQVRAVQFPDINPCDLPPHSQFSMTAGDFLEVYGTVDQTNAWDCVVTCFFIDCANNVIAYLERIYSCLKEGGTWINLGPLLYHYADMSEEKSIEPSFDLLLEIIKKIGFIVEKVDLSVPTLYTSNSKSMLSYTYNSVLLVCKKTNDIQINVSTTPDASNNDQ